MTRRPSPHPAASAARALAASASASAACGLAASTALLAACGTLGGDGGGGDNLPNRGIIPYVEPAEGSEPAAGERLPDPEGATWVEPFAVPTAGGVELWLERRSRARAEIGTLSSPDGVSFDDDFAVVLTPEAFSAATGIDTTHVGAPALLQDGTVRRLAVVWGSGEGIALGTWTGSFAADATVSAEEAGAARLGSPSLVRDADGRLWLFAEAAAPSGSEGPAVSIVRAPVDGGVGAFEAVIPGTAPCVDLLGESVECWDADGAGGPEVRLAETAAGRPYLRMFYVRGAAADDAVGFAASFDGATWDRFPYNPVVDDGRKKLRAPSNLRVGDTWLLYFERRSATGGGLAVAVNDKPHMADRLVE